LVWVRFGLVAMANWASEESNPHVPPVPYI
jgi:hypothetical protein